MWFDCSEAKKVTCCSCNSGEMPPVRRVSFAVLTLARAYGRLAVFLLVLPLCLGVSELVGVAYSQARMSTGYESLNRNAILSKDEMSVRILVSEIVGRTLFGHVTPSVVDRIVRAELSFRTGQQTSVTEEQISDAVNTLGTALIGSAYRPTNAAQVRLLRIAMCFNVPQLLKSPTPAASPALVGPDLSPSGASLLGLLLLRQKLTNPAWFADADQMNKQWVQWRPTQKSNTPPYRLGSSTASLTTTKLIATINEGMQDESSMIAAGFHSFLDRMALKR